MRQSVFFSILFLAAQSLWGAQTDFSRYQVIVDAKPFGDIPVAPAAVSSALGKVQPPQPPFTKDIRVVAMTEREGGILRVGFIDSSKKPPKTYYMRVGEMEDGIQVVQADYENQRAYLRKGGEGDWLYLGGRSQSGVAGAVGLTKPGHPVADASAESYIDRLRKRREETLRHRVVESPKLTGKDLERHLEEYQMEAIRKGMPPLPIPLTPEMDAQLVEEGVLPPQAGAPPAE